MFLLCFMFFSKLLMLFICFHMCCFDCKCKSLNRLAENRKTKRNRNNTEKLREKQKKQQKYRISSPRGFVDNDIFICGGSWAGYPVFLLFYVFLEAFLFYCMFLSVCCMCSPCLFKLLHLQLKKTHMKT